MTRAAIYLRLSKKGRDDDGNGDGESLAIDRQRKACRHLCEARGWEIVTEYVDDAVSASKSRDAAEFGKMIKDAKTGKFDVVVAYAVDRITRRLSDIETLINTGVRAATVQGDLDLTTPEGEAQGSILATFARMEARQKSKRQKDQGLEAAERGEPRRTRIRAFGYEHDGMTIRESEAAALKRAYGALLAGDSLVKITKDLAAEFQTPAGKPFHRSATRAILLNPRNAAIRTYWYKEIGPAQWPAIVDLETFRAVESLLQDPTRRKNHGTARRWLGGGLYRCGWKDDQGNVCGSDMRVNYRVEDKGPVRVYRCRKSAHLSRKAADCDAVVIENAIAALSAPSARDLLIDDDREDSAALRTEEATLRLRLDQLTEDFAEGAIDHSQFRAGSKRLKLKIADLEARMVHVDRGPLLADLVNAEDVEAAWQAAGLDRQRAVIDFFFTVTLLPRPGGRAPFSLLDSVQFDLKEIN